MRDMENEINVKQIAEETLVKMKLKSPYSIPANASERGLNYKEIRKYLADYALDTQDSIIAEIKRIIDEINKGFSSLDTKIDMSSQNYIVISKEEPTEHLDKVLWYEIIEEN